MVQNKTEQLGVRLTPAQMEEVRAKAAAQGFRVSEWVRFTVLERARRDTARRQDGGGLAPAA